MDNLQSLLDFSSYKTKSEIFLHAHVIAESVLLHWQFKSLKGSFHTIESIEFYIIAPNVFEDDSEFGGATHKRREQLSSGKFYIHTKSKGDRWTLPIFNRHGIDITSGNPETGTYAGILIRHLGGTNHRDGSGLALRAILRGHSGFEPMPRGPKNTCWTNVEAKILTDLNNADIFENSTGIILVRKKRPYPERFKIKTNKRIGIENTRFADELLQFSLESR